MKNQKVSFNVKPGAGMLIAIALLIGIPLHLAVAGQKTLLTRLEPTNKPVLLKDTLEINCKTKNTYWKFPNLSDYSSWVPQVRFHIFYNDSAPLRYQAEWFNADGSPWFSETLRYSFLSNEKTVGIQSDYSDELFNTKAVTTAGTYGIKITNQKTGELIFQGKFKVNKLLIFPGDARNKNRFQFYVDNDWSLALGYVGFDRMWLGSDTAPPSIFVWFKGRLNKEDLEARLYQNGQEVATTDAGGNIIATEERNRDCEYLFDKCQYHLWSFYWDKFRVLNSEDAARVRKQKPEVKFTSDMPGEYTVKVFYKNTQVREFKFAIDARGLLAANAFSEQLYLTNYKIVVPVKVMGNLDNWNPAAWKTEAFYGNPLSGFNIQ